MNEMTCRVRREGGKANDGIVPASTYFSAHFGNDDDLPDGREYILQPINLRAIEYAKTVQPRMYNTARMQYIHNAFCAVQVQSLLFPYGAESRAVGSAGSASLLVHMAEGSGMGVSCGTDHP